MERNIMGEFDMYRQAGTTPNFTDIARRYGMNRHTVAKYGKAGGQVEDARRCRPSGLDRHREVIEAKAQLPGATKRGIYEYLIDRCYAGEEPPAYNTLTKWMRRNGIECGRPPEGPEPHPRFETAPGEQMQFDWKESLRMADAEGEVFEFNVFSATLGYSRLHRFVYSRTRTEDDVMACLLAVMAANGGTARTLVECQHLFRQFLDAQTCFPELNGGHVPERRVKSNGVVPMHVVVEL